MSCRAMILFKDEALTAQQAFHLNQLLCHLNPAVAAQLSEPNSGP